MPERRTISAKGRSAGRMPTRASMTKRMTSASPMAASVWARMRPSERFLGGLFKAGGVDDAEFEIAETRLAFATVAGDAGLVVDERQLLADQPVEQGRLADIRPPDDGDERRHVMSSLGDLHRTARDQRSIDGKTLLQGLRAFRDRRRSGRTICRRNPSRRSSGPTGREAHGRNGARDSSARPAAQAAGEPQMAPRCRDAARRRVAARDPARAETISCRLRDRRRPSRRLRHWICPSSAARRKRARRV